MLVGLKASQEVLISTNHSFVILEQLTYIYILTFNELKVCDGDVTNGNQPEYR